MKILKLNYYRPSYFDDRPLVIILFFLLFSILFIEDGGDGFIFTKDIGYMRYQEYKGEYSYGITDYIKATFYTLVYFFAHFLFTMFVPSVISTIMWMKSKPETISNHPIVYFIRTLIPFSFVFLLCSTVNVLIAEDPNRLPHFEYIQIETFFIYIFLLFILTIFILLIIFTLKVLINKSNN